MCPRRSARRGGRPWRPSSTPTAPSLAAGESIVSGLSAEALKALMVSESDGQIVAAVLALLPVA
jgi:hypothetical protein